MQAAHILRLSIDYVRHPLHVLKLRSQISSYGLWLLNVIVSHFISTITVDLWQWVNDKWFIIIINSLWPRDAIRLQGTESTLAQVMACCLTAPSHYLKQCWLIISKVLWHSSEGIIMRRSEDTNQLKTRLKIPFLELHSDLPRANELAGPHYMIFIRKLPLKFEYFDSGKCFWSQHFYGCCHPDLGILE